MIISFEWLKQYVDLPMSTVELTDRLTLAGLNLEGFEQVGTDLAIDLEVTSNRADCLGHLGVAREVAVLWGSALRIPAAQPQEAGESAEEITRVELQVPDLCPLYTARIVRGVTIGPSPDWLASRLRTLGIAVVNNVVDVTNYVMMECGQPLHAFDLRQLRKGQIVVRRARAGETLVAIDHRQYELPADTCVIADVERAVALAGVMGGAASEVTAATVDLLIESAQFDPLSIRRTARHLNLHSASSYRFERGVDPQGIDWASRRCCELIQQVAGGRVAPGKAVAGSIPEPRASLTLRLAQIERLLGISIPRERIRSILTALGNIELQSDASRMVVRPPSWRSDLTREVDLIEEVARIHGYDQIPEDVGVKMAVSTRSREERVLDRVRHTLVAAGFFEALTLSAVEPDWIERFRPWSQAPPLATSTAVLRLANCLRQSLVPSLLAARRHNEKLSNHDTDLFEIANVYLPGSDSALPSEKRVLGLTTGRDFLALKGVLEAIAGGLNRESTLETIPTEEPLFAAGQSCQLLLDGKPLGVLGTLSDSGREAFELRDVAAAAEIDLGVLVEAAQLVPQARSLSPYPPVGRDLNIVVDEQVTWGEVAGIVARIGGKLIEQIRYRDTYRDAERLGAGKKSLLLSLQLRSQEATLTNEQADAVRAQIVAAIAAEVGGDLRA